MTLENRSVTPVNIGAERTALGLISLGATIRRARKQAGINQSALGEQFAAALGRKSPFSQTQMSDIERGVLKLNPSKTEVLLSLLPPIDDSVSDRFKDIVRYGTSTAPRTVVDMAKTPYGHILKINQAKNLSIDAEYKKGIGASIRTTTINQPTTLDREFLFSGRGDLYEVRVKKCEVFPDDQREIVRELVLKRKADARFVIERQVLKINRGGESK